MTRTMASHTYHGTKSIDVADPADHGIEAIAEPAQRSAERTRRGIGAEATIVEDRACVAPRRVRVDCLRDASDHAGIASAARLVVEPGDHHLHVERLRRGCADRSRGPRSRSAANGNVIVVAIAELTDSAMTAAVALSLDWMTQPSPAAQSEVEHA